MTVTAIESLPAPELAAAFSSTVAFPLPDDPSRSIQVVTREGWGCDERLRFNRRGVEIWPEMYVPAKKLVLHHTATSNAYVDGAAEVRAIYTYHAKTLGWGDIGYHLLVDRNGVVYEGRHSRGEGAGREIVGDDVVAGHVYAHNYGSVGVAAIGDHHAAPPSGALLQAIEDLFVWQAARQWVDPTGVSDFLRSDLVWHDDLDNLSGHRDSYNTLCPGDYLYALLGDLRATVAARLSSVGSSAVPALVETTGAARDLSEPATLAFTWSSPSSACHYALEGWSKSSRSEDINYLTGYEPAGYGDSLAWRQVWTGPSGATSATFTNLAAGRYTIHVRTADGRFAANQTWNVTPKKGRK
jgi:hypothetical protein